MTSIAIFRIDCIFGAYLEAPAMKLCEIALTLTLAELCYFILTSFNFNGHHEHEFFIAKALRQNKCRIDDECQPLLALFPLERSQQLFMRFDFRDQWIFKITRSRLHAQFNDSVTYPRVIEHIGKNPAQYPLDEKNDSLLFIP